jgi:UDP-N-acetylmuramoyl-tripeptide--D-alanyl-D-alanine ligase
MLNAPDDSDVMVLEMGMRGFGEVERLCGIAQPHIGVVTRVAEAHSDRVGGIDGVAIAKAELVRALPQHGTAILNADDPRVAAMAASTDAGVLTFGTSRGADVRVDELRTDELARARFTVHTPWGRFAVRLSMSGAHMALNAAAALAVVGVVGGDLDAAAASLSQAELSAMRMEMLRTRAGVLVINDCYNANPTSMRAALDALAAVPANRRVAILGAMGEISDAPAEHEAIAAYAFERNIQVVATGTSLFGITPDDDPVAVIGSLSADDAVLVKASRAAGLERVVAALMADG